MSSLDEYVYSESLMSDEKLAPAVDRQVLYINDSNSGSYNGSINFDSTVLANSGRWLDYSNATLQIPFVVAMQSSADVSGTGVANTYMMSLKNGTHHLIDSIQVDMQNSNIIQQQAFTNFYVNYKMMSSWSEDCLKKWGRECHFFPDSAGSAFAQAAASADGIGECNNRPYDNFAAAKTFTSSATLELSNMGLRKRIEIIANSAGDSGGLGMLTAAQCNAIGKSYSSGSGSGASKIYYATILATIRLKDIHDFFEKVPLLRGVSLRFTINYNSARVVVAIGNTGTTLATTSVTMLSGRTVPFMVCSGATAQPCKGILNGSDQTVTIEANVLATSSPALTGKGLLSSCRLYVPSYRLNPIDESRYLEQGVKEIEYDDVYGFVVSGVETRFNSILTNGIVDPQSLVIVPVLTSAENANFQTYQSVWDTVPGTTSYLAAITDFNVLVSGRALYQQNIAYDFDMFQNEVARVNALAGGSSDKMSSGLMGRYEWDNAYRYIVCDLSRRLPSEDRIPLAIQIQGQNGTEKDLDLYCFITYKRKVSVDLLSGAIVSR